MRSKQAQVTQDRPAVPAQIQNCDNEQALAMDGIEDPKVPPPQQVLSVPSRVMGSYTWVVRQQTAHLLESLFQTIPESLGDVFKIAINLQEIGLSARQDDHLVHRFLSARILRPASSGVEAVSGWAR